MTNPPSVPSLDVEAQPDPSKLESRVDLHQTGTRLEKEGLAAGSGTVLDAEACARLLDDLILMLAPHDAQSIADATHLTALKAALAGMGKDSETVAALTAKCADYDLLRKAVNDSTNECRPTCSSYGHEEDCPSCDPSRWLKDQQATIAALTAENERLRSTLTEVLACVGGGRLASIGSMGNTRCPQIRVETIDRWRAALPSSQETTGG